MIIGGSIYAVVIFICIGVIVWYMFFRSKHEAFYNTPTSKLSIFDLKEFQLLPNELRKQLSATVYTIIEAYSTALNKDFKENPCNYHTILQSLKNIKAYTKAKEKDIVVTHDIKNAVELLRVTDCYLGYLNGLFGMDKCPPITHESCKTKPK